MVAVGIIGFLASAGIAFAQTTNSGTATPSHPMILQVRSGGGVLMRGTISAVSSGSLTVQSWGGPWTVNVSSGTKVLPSGAALTDFKTGDFVGVLGTIDASANWTINATLVRDWTARQALNQEIRSNVQSVRQTMSSVPRVVQGKLSNLDTTTEAFTLTNAAGTAYTVTLNSDAKILGRNWATVTLSQATNGDRVRVFGTVSSTTIAASVFRDISVK